MKIMAIRLYKVRSGNTGERGAAVRSLANHPIGGATQALIANKKKES